MTSIAAADLTCRRWKVEWTHAGRVWGMSVAAEFPTAKRQADALAGFARRYARLLDRASDPRFDDPSVPVCEACTEPSPSEVDGLWGEGQRFGPLAPNRNRVAVAAKLDGLAKALAGQHQPRLEDAVRLTKDSKTAKPAARYLKALDAASRGLPALQLDLDRAAVLRSTASIARVGKAVDNHLAALAKEEAALARAVAKEIARVHGGSYAPESAPTGDEAPELVFEVDATRATLTHVRGAAKSTWFDGTVLIDGRITGRSLVAPPGKPLTCNNHTVECGFAYVPAIVRFVQTSDPARGHTQLLELWFQQDEWVAAPRFSR